MAEPVGNLFRKVFSPNYAQVRTLIKNKISPGGIQYTGFKYHPRHPETFKDPPYEPTKLFLVTRIKKVPFTNPVERKALQIFNIDGHKFKFGHIAILKNIPEVNEYLWKIKHLVKIVPIKLTGDLPENLELGSTFLHDDGRLEVMPKVANVQQRAELLDEFKKSPTRMCVFMLRRMALDRWNKQWHGTINDY